MAALAADVGHLCNPTSVAHIRRYGNIPAFKLPTLLNVTNLFNALISNSWILATPIILSAGVTSFVNKSAIRY
jgi:hypothetical protein